MTSYGVRMKNTQCNPKQHMVVKTADYGDFDKNGTFNDDKNVDTICSALARCQLKSRCDGKISCELTINNNLLPLQVCLNSSKEIYTKYTCVDTYSLSTITEGNSRYNGNDCSLLYGAHSRN